MLVEHHTGWWMAFMNQLMTMVILSRSCECTRNLLKISFRHAAPSVTSRKDGIQSWLSKGAITQTINFVALTILHGSGFWWLVRLGIEPEVRSQTLQCIMKISKDNCFKSFPSLFPQYILDEIVNCLKTKRKTNLKRFIYPCYSRITKK